MTTNSSTPRRASNVDGVRWMRVTPQQRCPICNHNSWCLIKPGVTLCMRVQSNHPVNFKTGETGWLHEKDSKVVYRPLPPEKVETIDAAKIIKGWQLLAGGPGLDGISNALGVSRESLVELGCTWAPTHQAWAFPMRNGFGAIVGIRLRTNTGAKFAVRGSTQGCFIPNRRSDNLVLICEGPTDTAAALTLGYYAIGRPSCRGGVADLLHWTTTRGITRAVIIADNDGPGADGAELLARQLTIRSCTVVLPAKDIRHFLYIGGTKTVLDDYIKASVWTVK